MANARSRRSRTDLRPAEITCLAPDAQAVFVAGSFNGWSPTATPMRREQEGQWVARLTLPKGEHEYKFVVDGKWCCQPGCADRAADGSSGLAPNPFGTANRVLNVE